MRRLLTTVVLVVSLLLSATTPAAAFTHDDIDQTIQKYPEGPSFIVSYEVGGLSSLESWASSSDDRRLVRSHNGSQTATITAPRSHVVDSLWLRASSLDFGVAPLEDRSYITSVRPNYVLSYAEPVTLSNESDWQTPKIGIAEFNDPSYPTDGVAFDNVSATGTAAAADAIETESMDVNGSGMTVAVIDTGCNVAGGSLDIQNDLHKDSASFLGGDVDTVNESGYEAVEDENGHGSWVTASITGNSTYDNLDGIAPGAEILCLQALDSDGSGSTSNIASAIRYARDANASVDVITMSLGSPIYSESLQGAIEYALEDDEIVTITAAAGNSRQTTRFVASPADVEGVIGVGATTNEEVAKLRSASFSQVSGQSALDTSLQGDERVDVAAPGMKLTTRVPTTGGSARNHTASGTSMAAPLAAGAITLAIEDNSTLATLSPEEIEETVRDTARPEKNLAIAETGGGVVAAENLAHGTQPSVSQEEARTSEASQRDEYYDALADGSGGLLARIGWGG